MFTIPIHRVLFTAGAALAVASATTAPALAQGTPTPYVEPVTATIQSAISITGLTPVAFPATVPGTPVTFVESYSTASNDAAGYVISVADTGTSPGLTGSGGALGNVIPDSDITITNNKGNANVPLTTAQSTLYAPTGAGGMTGITDTWTLSIPSAAALPAGSYAGQVTYEITGA